MYCSEEDCIFCKIANKQIETEIVYESTLLMVVLDIDPINDGHVLIIPKKHVHDLDELDAATATEIMAVSKMLVKVIKDVYKPQGYSIMQNGGEFNDIGHYHMHVFPRYANDGFGWTFGNNKKTSSLSEHRIMMKEKFDLFWSHK